mmetsp:Transcript_139415/g.259935  ORF Transcript_139415/g.259935 Transcript_139415/m.259935 type:complete len:203 (-) Transcript_139415:1036-1644(-)
MTSRFVDSSGETIIQVDGFVQTIMSQELVQTTGTSKDWGVLSMALQHAVTVVEVAKLQHRNVWTLFLQDKQSIKLLVVVHAVTSSTRSTMILADACSTRKTCCASSQECVHSRRAAFVVVVSMCRLQRQRQRQRQGLQASAQGQFRAALMAALGSSLTPSQGRSIAKQRSVIWIIIVRRTVTGFQYARKLFATIPNFVGPLG